MIYDKKNNQKHLYLTTWGKYTVFEKVKVENTSVVCWETPHPSRAAGFAASGRTEKDRSAVGSLLPLVSARQGWSSQMETMNKWTEVDICSCIFEPVHRHLCDPRQLGAELGQGRMLLGLNIRVKLRLHFPRGRVQQNSRKLNWKKKQKRNVCVCVIGSKREKDEILTKSVFSATH